MHAPLPPAFRVEWRELAALAPLTDEWRELAAGALEPNVFYRPEFALAAAPVFGAGVGAGLVRTAAGRLVGLFPARIERWRGPSPTLVGWTHPFAPLGTPLVGGSDPEGVVAAWLDHLARERAMPARLLLPLLPADGAFAAVLDAVLARRGLRSAAFGCHRRALLDPGPERQGYLGRAVSSGRRKELRRQRRRLEDLAPVTFATAQGADLAAALGEFLMLEANGWKGAAGTAIASEPAVRRFVESALTALAASGGARVDRLLHDGRAIAATVTLISGDTAWCWKIAYDETLRHASPGVQLICDLTDSLLSAERPRRVDSCAVADHPMIDHIWRERLTIGDRLIALKPAAMSFGLACRAEQWRRTALDVARAARRRLRRS